MIPNKGFIILRYITIVVLMQHIQGRSHHSERKKVLGGRGQTVYQGKPDHLP